MTPDARRAEAATALATQMLYPRRLEDRAIIIIAALAAEARAAVADALTIDAETAGRLYWESLAHAQATTTWPPDPKRLPRPSEIVLAFLARLRAHHGAEP